MSLNRVYEHCCQLCRSSNFGRVPMHAPLPVRTSPSCKPWWCPRVEYPVPNAPIAGRVGTVGRNLCRATAKPQRGIGRRPIGLAECDIGHLACSPATPNVSRPGTAFSSSCFGRSSLWSPSGPRRVNDALWG